jgi:transposase-like protein
VDRLEGSDIAQERLRAILDTLGGHTTIVEASRELGISEPMFYKMRDAFLQGAIGLLEPKKSGRKPHQPEPVEVTQLRSEVERLQKELLGARVREELAVLGSKTADLPAEEKKPRPSKRKKPKR